MLVLALRQRVDGRVIPRHHLRNETDALTGDLQVSDGLDPILRRHCLVARLVDPDAPHRELWPPLKDARLLYVDRERLVITGFEEQNDRDYAQTWMLCLHPESLHSLKPIRRR